MNRPVQIAERINREVTERSLIRTDAEDAAEVDVAAREREAVELEAGIALRHRADIERCVALEIEVRVRKNICIGCVRATVEIKDGVSKRHLAALIDLLSARIGEFHGVVATVAVGACRQT